VFEHARQAAGSGQPLSPQFAGVYHKLIDGLLAAGQPVGGLSGPVAVREVVDAGVKAHETFPLEIPADGLVLYPGVTYLACTREVTETYGLVPRIDGRSSVGRLGMFVHVTAAFGDDGFCGPFTLELAVVQPLRIPQDMRCAQISYTEVKGKRKPYAGRYQKAAGAEASKYAQ
jgi:deoxycytidine triphosphate deaminase